MPVTYPIAFPYAFRNISFEQVAAQAAPASPFSLVPQVQVWGGQIWRASCQLPPMKRTDGEAVLGLLTSLNLYEGSLLLGDTASKLPRGVGLSTALIAETPATRNGGFETAGAGGADVLASWEETTSGTTSIARDTSVFNSGGASCRINVDASLGEGYVRQPVLTAGLRYRVAFWARNGGGAGGVLAAYDATTVLATGALTASWQFFTADFVAGGTGFVLGRDLNSASQSIWIDDVQLHCLETYGGLVNGGGQTGGDLQTDGWLAGQTNILCAGDWIQIGTGASARLYKVLQGANSNSSGQATLLIWPKLRSSPADNAAVIVHNTVGRFMLSAPVQWSIDERKIYEISFTVMEDLRA